MAQEDEVTLVKSRPSSRNYGSSYQDIPLDSDSLMESSSYIDRSNRRNGITHMNPTEFRNLCIGYTFVFFINIGYTVSLVMAQLTVGEVSIWLLNLMRFSFEAIMAGFMIVLCGNSFLVKKKDIPWLLLIMITYYVYNTSYYLAPSVLPLGNLQATFTTFLIVCAVTVDIMMKSVHRLTTIAALLCSSGLLLLIQPWAYQLNSEIYSLTPCKVWDIGCNTTLLQDLNGTCVVNGTIIPTTTGYYLFGITIDATIAGYLLVLSGALALCITFNIVRKMSVTYPVPVLVFWVDMALSAVSLVITGAVEKSFWNFPTGLWCVLATLTFIFSSVIDNLMCFYGYHYLPVSQVTLGVAPTTVSLYICQRTFLKTFHPGHANILEELGITIIVIGSTLSQLLAIVGDCKKPRTQTSSN